jgi:hypothetical protein
MVNVDMVDCPASFVNENARISLADTKNRNSLTFCLYLNRKSDILKPTQGGVVGKSACTFIELPPQEEVQSKHGGKTAELRVLRRKRMTSNHTL